MIAAGERELCLAQPHSGGGTLRDHLLAAERQGARPAELLAAPPMPAAAEALWSFFLTLHAARGAAVTGLAPLGFAELEAAARLAQVQLTPWEVETLMDLDRMARRVIAPPAAPRAPHP